MQKNKQKEIEFRENLVNILSNPPFNHDLYYHEGNYPNKFSISNSEGYIDLLMLTNPTWIHHPKFPIIGIETKVTRKLGWLIDTTGQLDKYYEDLLNAEYYIDRRQVKSPNLFLVATDDLIYNGYFYCWNEPRVVANNEDYKTGWWTGLTEFYDRVLWKRQAALLRKDSFLYQQKRYELTVI